MTNETPRQLFTIITEAARRKLWPKHRVGLGLFLNLIFLVTVEVHDPRDAKKKIGIVLGGSLLTNADLAARIGCPLDKLRYEKQVLLEEELLIQRRYRYGFRLAIRESDKWTSKHQALLYPRYSWVQEGDASSRLEPDNTLSPVRTASLPQSDRQTPQSGVVAPQSDVVAPQSQDSEVVENNGESKLFGTGKAELKGYKKGIVKSPDPTSSLSFLDSGSRTGEASDDSRGQVARQFFAWLHFAHDLSLTVRQKETLERFILSSHFDLKTLRFSAGRILDPLDVADSYSHAASKLVASLVDAAEATLLAKAELARRAAMHEAMVKQPQAERYTKFDDSDLIEDTLPD
jgi:hypothetical protein